MIQSRRKKTTRTLGVQRAPSRGKKGPTGGEKALKGVNVGGLGKGAHSLEMNLLKVTSKKVVSR